MEKALTFTITEDNRIRIEAKGDINYPEIVQAAFTALAHFADKTMHLASLEFKAKNPEASEEEVSDIREHVRGEIYDMINLAASNTLYLIAPDYELRPDLTAQAILKAENEILDSTEETKDEKGLQ